MQRYKYKLREYNNGRKRKRWLYCTICPTRIQNSCSGNHPFHSSCLSSKSFKLSEIDERKVSTSVRKASGPGEVEVALREDNGAGDLPVPARVDAVMDGARLDCRGPVGVELRSLSPEPCHSLMSIANLYITGWIWHTSYSTTGAAPRASAPVGGGTPKWDNDAVIGGGR